MGEGNKKGGGSSQAPQVNAPAGLYQTAASTTGLGQYATSLLDSVSSMTNWASSLASGGHSSSIPSYASSAVQAGPQVSFGGKGNLWNSSFDPSTGLVTYTNPANPNQTFTENIVAQNAQGNLPANIQQQWQNDYYQHQQAAASGGGNSTTGWSQAVTSGTLPTGITNQQALDFYQAKNGQPAPNLQTAINYFNQEGSTAAGQNPLGPFLSQAMGAIQGQENQISQTQNFVNETGQEGTKLINQGESMLTQATTGTGLYPSQQAMIDEAVSSEKTNLSSALGGAGLGKSTQLTELQSEADLAGAATGGQLVQQNITAAQQQIALGQASQKLSLAGQTLTQGEQAAIVQELQSLQTNFWTEAMQGYGALGSIIDSAGKSYGISLSAYNDVLQSEEANAANQTELAKAQLSADTSSSNSLMGALGSLFGQGGSGSSLLGSVGGAIGGGTAAAGSAAGTIGAVADLAVFAAA